MGMKQGCLECAINGTINREDYAADSRVQEAQSIELVVCSVRLLNLALPQFFSKFLCFASLTLQSLYWGSFRSEDVQRRAQVSLKWLLNL